MSEISSVINKLEKEISEKSNEIATLKALKSKFTDLETHTNRWNKVRYISKLVNSIATECEIYHSCGCCNDSPLKISPYIKTEYGKVYSYPCEFVIGEKFWEGGDKENSGWKEWLRKNNISEAIIKIAEIYFKDNLPYYKLKEMMEDKNESKNE